MNDHDKRLRFREILAAPNSSIAPSAPDPHDILRLAGGSTAARTMRLTLRETGRIDGYFGAVDGYPDVRHWCEDLGFPPTQPRISD